MKFLAEFDAVVHPGQSIADGIARCRQGGRLLVRPGTYREDFELASEKLISIFGQSLVTVTGTVTSRSQGSALDGFTLSHLVIVSGRIEIKNCRMVGGGGRQRRRGRLRGRGRPAPRLPSLPALRL